MKFTEPRVFRLAGTSLDFYGVNAYLKEVGAEKWGSDSNNDGEVLVEIAGKTCYRSFHEDLNANLKRVRSGDNAGYVGNIIKSQHGSVLEHVYDTFALVGVSRVLTHEMVRHRLCNFSQESLRFVRLTELAAMYPGVFSKEFLEKIGVKDGRSVGHDITNQETADYLQGLFQETFEHLEDVQLQMANALDLDNLQSFDGKKKLTSGMRRLAPIGLATTLIMTTNARNWRHIVQQRTSRHAEEEIRMVTGTIFRMLSVHNPNLYQDAKVELVDGYDEVTFEHGRI